MRSREIQKASNENASCPKTTFETPVSVVAQIIFLINEKTFLPCQAGDTHSLPSPTAGRNDSPHELTELSDVQSKQ